MALAYLGVGVRVMNITSDTSENAKTLNLFYDTVRDAVLADFQWPFAQKRSTLALVENDPNDDWSFSYRYPTDAIRINRVYPGIYQGEVDTLLSDRILRSATFQEYEIGSDSSGGLIFSNETDAGAVYTYRHTTTALYPPNFTLLLSYRLAAQCSSVLTGGDPFKLGPQAWQLYVREMGYARANAANEERPALGPEDPLSLSRR